MNFDFEKYQIFLNFRSAPLATTQLPIPIFKTGPKRKPKLVDIFCNFLIQHHEIFDDFEPNVVAIIIITKMIIGA